MRVAYPTGLLIHFKQALKQEQEIIGPANKAAGQGQEKYPSWTPGRGIVTFLGEKLSQLWKMGIHWIKGIQNLLLKPLTPDVAAVINAIQ